MANLLNTAPITRGYGRHVELATGCSKPTNITCGLHQLIVLKRRIRFLDPVSPWIAWRIGGWYPFNTVIKRSVWGHLKSEFAQKSYKTKQNHPKAQCWHHIPSAFPHILPDSLQPLRQCPFQYLFRPAVQATEEHGWNLLLTWQPHPRGHWVIYYVFSQLGPLASEQ